MKRIIYFMAALLFSLWGIHSAMGYSAASVENKAALTIANPHGLLSFVPLSDQLCIRQGETEGAFQITNNLQTNVSYFLECNQACLSPEPDDGLLYPGESIEIALCAADSCPTGELTLAAILQASFTGGSGRLLADLNVYVENGDLQLDLEDDGFVTSWNDNTAPEGTAILYRYKDDAEGEWSDWAKIDGDSETDISGHYEYKAVLGETESEVLSNVVEPSPVENEDADMNTNHTDPADENSTSESNSEN